jgi:uncharacterized protein YmfQ (DUF2313 family)
VKHEQSVSERRTALVMKMTLLGSQSRPFFIDAAAQLGYTITISEYMPYQCGFSRVGDTRNSTDNPDSPTEYAWQLGPPEMRYNWTVHVSALKITHFFTGISECGIDRLLGIQYADDLECMLDHIKPTHTDIIFDYSSVVALDMSAAYNSQYLALGVP